MNRQLKFRIWNNTDKEMYFSKPLEFRNLGYMDIEDGGDGLYGLMGHALTTSKGIDTNKKEFIIQQFTGLKDKDGKEIYEGDIIIYNRAFEQEREVKELISFVRYQEAKFGFDLTGFNGMFFDLCDEYNLEVVGNIFENSELLNNELEKN